MEQPWYRQYFWLLVFGGIVLFTGIITFIMICICKSLFIKRVTSRIQKTIKRTPNKYQADNAAYQSKVPPTLITPESMHHDSAAISEISTSNNVPHYLYATAKKPKQSHLPGIYPDYNVKKYETKSDIPYKDDRSSFASYDSVGNFTNVEYYNTVPAAHQNYGKRDNRNLDVYHKNDRYSNASYDSVGHIPGVAYNNIPTLGSQYYARKDHVDFNKNDRYSFASFDSYDSDYSNARISVIPKDQEYVDVIAEEDDVEYDDVDIN